MKVQPTVLKGPHNIFKKRVLCLQFIECALFQSCVPEKCISIYERKNLIYDKGSKWYDE